MCIIQNWTTCICSVHKNKLQNQMFVLGCKIRSHARNENECQTPWHRRLAANIEIHGFKILVNRKIIWNSWNLTWYDGTAATCNGKNIVPFGAGVGISFSQTRASLRTSLMVSVGYVPPWGTKQYRSPLIAFKKNPRINIEQQECRVKFWNFFGDHLDIFIC